MAQDMSGRVCIITGASSGIGLETARSLAGAGARLGLICRSRDRGDEAVRRIRQETGNQEVALHLADLRSQAQVRRAAAEILQRYPRIHVLLNNAGLIAPGRSLTEDGVETVFAVNYLSHFLLTRLLLERLKASAPARVILVVSTAFMMGNLRFDDLGAGKGPYRSMRAYADAKLAGVYFTRELARRLEGTGVTANCLHPGIVATRFGRELTLAQKLMALPMLPFLRGPRRGARTSIHLATSPEVEGVSGRFFSNCRARKLPRKARNLEKEQELWRRSEAMLGAV